MSEYKPTSFMPYSQATSTTSDFSSAKLRKDGELVGRTKYLKEIYSAASSSASS